MLVFNDTLKNEQLLYTYNQYKTILSRFKNTPLLNYFGINYENGRIKSIKFYFHIFNKLTHQQLTLFIPTNEDYYHFEKHRIFDQSPSLNQTGCAFELKFYANETHAVQGFHYKLKPDEESYKLLEFPKSIPQHLKDTALAPAINYEYFSQHKLFKKYFYFNKVEAKGYFSDRFQIKELMQASFIEYSENEAIRKINAIYNDKLYLDHLVKMQESEEVAKICNTFNLYIKFVGYYESHNIKAYYFYPKNVFGKDKMNSILNIDTLQNILSL